MAHTTYPVKRRLNGYNIVSLEWKDSISHFATIYMLLIFNNDFSICAYKINPRPPKPFHVTLKWGVVATAIGFSLQNALYPCIC